MGGAVSSGHDNDELIDHLIGGNYIRSPAVERVFRALDRGDYMTVEARHQAYKDLAWKNGLLHLSAPCIYSEVMEGLLLEPGMSFLNIGSGTGYLSTLAGLMLGSSGTNHGVEIYKSVIEYANKKLTDFVENSPIMDEFDFCEPKFFQANGLNLAPPEALYDRVYCGAACPVEYSNYLKSLIKVGGILVMPLHDNLVQVRRLATQRWHMRSLLSVSFATLRIPSKEEAKKHVKLEAVGPRRLEQLSRAAVRRGVRAGLLARRPDLRPDAPPRPAPATPTIRRIRIPLDEDSNLGLNALHDLDGESGANEMNALLSLVLSMGQHSGAGALRLQPASDSEPDVGDGDDGDPAARGQLLLDRYEPATDQSSDDNHNDNNDNSNDNNGNGNNGNENNGNGVNDNNENGQPPISSEEEDSSEESQESTSTSPEPPSTSDPKTEPSTSQYVSQSSSSRTEGGASKTEDDVEWDGDTDEDADDDDDEEDIHVRRQKRQKLDSGIGDDHACGSSPDKTSDTSKMDATDTSERCSSSSSTSDEADNMPLRRKKRPRSTGRSGPASRRPTRLAPPTRRSVRLAPPSRRSARLAPPSRRSARLAPPSRSSARLASSSRRAARTGQPARRSARLETRPAGPETGRTGGAGPEEQTSPPLDEGLQRTRQESLRRLDVSVNMRRAIHRLPLPPALKLYVNHNRGFQ